eukprot:gene33-15_t
MSGVLLTINPRQADRALREAQQYFNSITDDLQSAHKSLIAPSSETRLEPAATSTSALLAAELEDAVQQDQMTRKRNRQEDVQDSWFSSIDTCCKGYLLLRIPAIDSQVASCKEVHNESVADGCDNHSISINPLVSNVIERVFQDLMTNPRPVFRYCFRLSPVETRIYFAGRLDQPIPFPQSKTQQRSLDTILFKFSVKNNTKVQQNQRILQESLMKVFPLNRFIVLTRETQAIEAAVSIVVLQSTCTIGIQRCYSNRKGYNIGDLGRGAFEVSALLNKPGTPPEDDDIAAFAPAAPPTFDPKRKRARGKAGEGLALAPSRWTLKHPRHPPEAPHRNGGELPSLPSDFAPDETGSSHCSSPAPSAPDPSDLELEKEGGVGVWGGGVGGLARGSWWGARLFAGLMGGWAGNGLRAGKEKDKTGRNARPVSVRSSGCLLCLRLLLIMNDVEN